MGNHFASNCWTYYNFDSFLESKTGCLLPKVVTLFNGTIGYALGRTYILFLCMIFVLLVQKALNQLMTDDSWNRMEAIKPSTTVLFFRVLSSCKRTLTTFLLLFLWFTYILVMLKLYGKQFRHLASSKSPVANTLFVLGRICDRAWLHLHVLPYCWVLHVFQNLDRLNS